MQDSKPRRKPLTYGKSSKRHVPHYAFVEPVTELDGVETPDSSWMNKRTQKKEWQKDLCSAAPKLQSPQTFRNSQHNLEEQKESAEIRTGSSDLSDGRRSIRLKNGSAESTLFDFPSSDESGGTNSFMDTIRKRRKLTPVGKGDKKVKDLRLKVDLMHPSSRSQLSTRRNDSAPASDEKELERTSITLAVPKTQSRLPDKERSTKKTLSKPKTSLFDGNGAKSIANALKRVSSFRSSSSEGVDADLDGGEAPSAQLLGELSEAALAGNKTDKKERAQKATATLDNGTASPSQLGLKSLRLTPERSTAADINWEEGCALLMSMSQQATPLRSRRRLVDALDSPRKRSRTRALNPMLKKDLYDDRTEQDNQITRHLKSKEPLNIREETTTNKPLPSLPTAASRITYEKQRSHLSDMVDDLSIDLAVPSISHLQEPTVTVRNSASSSFDVKSSVEEQELEEEQGAVAIKSIHELRQAGVNARFLGNLESTFEDIEDSSPSSKARRLRGLMQLAEHLQDQSFSLQFLENAMDKRLALCASYHTDLMTSTLMGFTLSSLLSSVHPSLNTFQKSFDSVMQSSVPLLQETREFSHILSGFGRDKKQNLSPGTCKDILAFQKTIIASSVWLGRPPSQLTPQIVALRAIETTIRGVREYKDFETSIPPSVFEALVRILTEHSRGESNNVLSADSLLIIRSAISILEYSTLGRVIEDQGYFDCVQRLSCLSSFFPKLAGLPQDQQAEIKQLILRLILNITNNNPILCAILSKEKFILAIFDIITSDFIQTLANADTHGDLDESKLALVILALGSLINFAECSEASRDLMRCTETNGQTLVKWLVSAFVGRAETAAEASSLEQTHGLVAFGYLSMLLSTLCLNDEIRTLVCSELKDGSLAQLLYSVDEFLNHFRVVEKQSIEDEVVSNFTKRFETIVLSLKGIDPVTLG